MTRNTQRRVEIACPILDEEVRRQILHDVEVLLADNVKARRLTPDGRYVPVPDAGGPPVDAQAVFLEEARQQEPPDDAAPPPAPDGAVWESWPSGCCTGDSDPAKKHPAAPDP